jgi:hypothetical protein
MDRSDAKTVVGSIGGTGLFVIVDDEVSLFECGDIREVSTISARSSTSLLLSGK